MAGRIQFFKCEKCGNVYEKVFSASGCTPACCSQPTVPLEAQTADPDEQKHVPWIEKRDGGILVRVGKTSAHPMSEDHRIAFIAICADGVLMRKDLRPEDEPQAFFPAKADRIVAWEYCNKHGLWKSQRTGSGGVPAPGPNLFPADRRTRFPASRRRNASFPAKG